jgi:hypothetical protein
MNQLPERAPVGQPLSNEAAAVEAERIIATAFRDPTPVPTVGATPPVPQPGRPPMSQGATDASVLMLAGGATTVMVGGTAATLMYVSQFADPVVCALVFGAPAALVLAISRLVRRAKDVLPAEVHQHYSGPIYQDQRNVHSHSSWLGKTTNNL